MASSASSWPSEDKLDMVRTKVREMSGIDKADVRIVVSPYRICPLGAHIDHQGGTVTAMTINKGILLGFVPSNDGKVALRSGQFPGEVNFSFHEIQNCSLDGKDSSFKTCNKEWGSYARGAVFALKRHRHLLTKGITGFICDSDGLDSSGLSSSAAVGIAYLLALEDANNLHIEEKENIELDRLIENEYLGLKNGILDQSAILLSEYGHLTRINCKTIEHEHFDMPKPNGNQQSLERQSYKILLAMSGIKEALTKTPEYNCRVYECQQAAKILLLNSGDPDCDNKIYLLSDVNPEKYEAQKANLNGDLAKRAKHYFSESKRVTEGIKAWASGRLSEFGRLITESGLSSIDNYGCGYEPINQLREILVNTPGVFGARFSGAGFRGCCLAFVDADHADEIASRVKTEYQKAQPELASKVGEERLVLLCDSGQKAHVL